MFLGVKSLVDNGCGPSCEASGRGVRDTEAMASGLTSASRVKYLESRLPFVESGDRRTSLVDSICFNNISRKTRLHSKSVRPFSTNYFISQILSHESPSVALTHT